MSVIPEAGASIRILGPDLVIFAIVTLLVLTAIVAKMVRVRRARAHR